MFQGFLAERSRESDLLRLELHGRTAQLQSRVKREKRRAYDERVREVERACFSPLVFAATGGMGPTATTVFKKLASLLSEKRSINYSKCLYWLRCRLCYSLLRSSVMCLRGHRSTQQHQTLKWPTLKVTLSLAAVFECWSPSCPALCHLVLGVVAKKKNKINIQSRVGDITTSLYSRSISLHLILR